MTTRTGVSCRRTQSPFLGISSEAFSVTHATAVPSAHTYLSWARSQRLSYLRFPSGIYGVEQMCISQRGTGSRQPTDADSRSYRWRGPDSHSGDSSQSAGSANDVRCLRRVLIAVTENRDSEAEQMPKQISQLVKHHNLVSHSDATAWAQVIRNTVFCPQPTADAHEAETRT